MSPQIAAGRKFFPFKEAARFFKEDKLPDLGGLTLTAALYDCPPLIFKTLKENEVGFNGIEIYLLDQLAEVLNFSWTANEMMEDRYGSRKNGTWIGGVVGSMLQQKSDIGLGGFWISYDRYPFVEITTDYTQMDIVYVMPRRFQDDKWKSIYTPFSGPLWTCIISTVVTSFLVLYYLSQLVGKGTKLHDWIFLVVGQFLGCSPLPSEGPTMFRIATLFVSVAALFVSTLYSSAIVSHLTRPPVLMQPQTVKDLVEMGFFWTLNYPVPKPYSYLRLENKWHRRFVNSYRNSLNIPDGRYAVLCKMVENVLVVEDFPHAPYTEGAVLKSAYALPEVINTYFLGIAFMKGSPLAKPASQVLEILKAGGIISKAMKEISGKFVGDDNTPHASTPHPMTLKSLQGAFFILVLGLVLAGIVFIVEKCVFSFHNRKKYHEVSLAAIMCNSLQESSHIPMYKQIEPNKIQHHCK